MLRLPKKVTLPFGYTVTIKQLKDAEFDIYDKDADGVWMYDTRTILIRKRLPAKRRAYILAHELGHAWLDWTHLHLDSSEMKP